MGTYFRPLFLETLFHLEDQAPDIYLNNKEVYNKKL